VFKKVRLSAKTACYWLYWQHAVIHTSYAVKIIKGIITHNCFVQV